MNLELLNSELRSSSRYIINTQAHYISGSMGTTVQKRGDHNKSTPSNYFSIEALLVLVCLTASLLFLPLILPPLPPPPITLLLLPVGILVVLFMLAFVPSDMRNIASSYL